VKDELEEKRGAHPNLRLKKVKVTAERTASLAEGSNKGPNDAENKLDQMTTRLEDNTEESWKQPRLLQELQDRNKFIQTLQRQQDMAVQELVRSTIWMVRRNVEVAELHDGVMDLFEQLSEKK
jgi:hypothetical protein